MKLIFRHRRGFSEIKRPRLFALLLAALCWCIAGSSIAGEGSHLLDGKSFLGKNGEKGQKLAEYEDEEIIFKDGLFTSASCLPYNFRSAPYTAEAVDGKIRFTTVTESPTHGEITWEGVIDGNRADVTFVWTKKRWYWDTRREYWFHGVLKE